LSSIPRISGRNYPDDFGLCLSVSPVAAGGRFYGGRLVARRGDQAVRRSSGPEFPRSYIDVNRAEDDIDPAVLAEPWPVPLAPCDRTLLGSALCGACARAACRFMPRRCRLPKFSIVSKILPPIPMRRSKASSRDVVAVFGECVLIDVHSMPGLASDNARTARPDFILGDRQGTSCDPSLTRQVSDFLREMGFSVALNDPYKGMEIVRRYGQPQTGRQALQLEINRRLYMNEDTLTLHDGFPRLQNALGELFRFLASSLMRDRPEQMAAEIGARC